MTATPDRRTVLAALSSAALLGAATPAWPQTALPESAEARLDRTDGAPVELKVTTFVPGQDALAKVVETWALEVERRSNGQVRFVFFPSSQMGPPDRQFDLVRTGAADVSLFLHGFTPGRFPTTELAYLPGTFAGVGSERGAEVLFGLAGRYLTQEHAGTKLLAIAPTPESFVFSAKSFPTFESLAGQRIRHPGATMADTLRAIGAVPVGVPSPEMADALGKGLVDGLGINWQAAADWRIEEVGTALLELPLGAVSFGVALNAERYDAMPPELKDLIDETSADLSRKLGRELGDAETQAAERLRPQFDVTVPPEDDVRRFRTVVDARREARIAAIEALGHPAREFYDQLLAGLGKA